MKITIFGLTLTSSWGNGHATPYRAMVRALHRAGHAVTFYEQNAEYYARHRDLPRCSFCSLVLYDDWHEVRPAALAEAAASDIVINASYCPSGAEICDEVLALAGPLHVFYDLDTPITLQNLAAGDLDYLRRSQISEFDLYLSFTGGAVLRELEQVWGARMARPLSGCVDPDVHRRTPTREEFACDLSYMGTYAADRQSKLERFFLGPARRLPQKTFVLAGALYPWQWTWPENVGRHEHVAPADHAALYSSSRATLNITRDGMARTGYCPSGRFFEAAACGTPIISDWFEGLDTFFSPGEEIVVAQDTEDILDALTAGDSELHRMADRARRRTLDEHTGEVRARQLIDFCEEAQSCVATQAVCGRTQ